MKIWAVVPVKRLSETKSRLQSVLSPAERAALTIGLFRNLLTEIQKVDAIEQTVVISRDQTILEMASTFKTVSTQENETDDLNQSLQVGVRCAKSLGASHTFILPSDLPLVTKADLTRFLAYATENQLLICSDKAMRGTNAICLPTNLPYHFQYGPNSLAQHMAEACRMGLKPRLIINRNIQFDLDTIRDWQLYQLR